MLDLGRTRQAGCLNIQMAVKRTYSPVIHQTGCEECFSGEFSSSSCFSLPLFFSCHNNASSCSLLPLLPPNISSLLVLVWPLMNISTWNQLWLKNTPFADGNINMLSYHHIICSSNINSLLRLALAGRTKNGGSGPVGKISSVDMCNVTQLIRYFPTENRPLSCHWPINEKDRCLTCFIGSVLAIINSQRCQALQCEHFAPHMSENQIGWMRKKLFGRTGDQLGSNGWQNSCNNNKPL